MAAFYGASTVVRKKHSKENITKTICLVGSSASDLLKAIPDSLNPMELICYVLQCSRTSQEPQTLAMASYKE